MVQYSGNSLGRGALGCGCDKLRCVISSPYIDLIHPILETFRDWLKHHDVGRFHFHGVCLGLGRGRLQGAGSSVVGVGEDIVYQDDPMGPMDVGSM